ncbi:NAD(P)H-dependent flavin oxidoreductase [Tsukamurella pseudospumae]|uniref:Propionate 3-nitronate monooxygenase n=1 Tax=Tsukamurella pseudospumae TaxID=239498 RepID=A0A138ATR5_9ACTN|nr:nitronate monooxygenase [Tsukamurella pseudospumae]KXP13822.1 2-nitropropane dioxygenase [Tsukamurella pseudospumae]
MFDFRDLHTRVVAAPMAGGPSTPSLVVAAERAGGIGQLAAGYRTPEQLSADIQAVRREADLFGVNLFVPEERPIDGAALSDYRRALIPYAEQHGVELPELDDIGADDDYYNEKLALVCAHEVPVVSFTFGCPTPRTIDRLHKAGASVGVTVTTADDALTAADAGADWICVQGPEAGGHRATYTRDIAPPIQPLHDLIRDVRQTVSLPLVASGGIATAEQADAARGLGPVAVQVGTVLLRTTEAGTKPAHAAALADPTRTETVVTRAFSGRAARGLRNTFIDQFNERAVPEYPAVNTLTTGFRRTLSGNPDAINLWAGTGYQHAQVESAVDAVKRLG